MPRHEEYGTPRDVRQIIAVRCLCVFLLLILHPSAYGQNFPSGFSFVLPPSDTAASRFLPAFPRVPINDGSAISIDANGHFVAGTDPIRFWGTNLVADGAFPTKSKAWFIAGHLRKVGFNLVRFHHLDNPWSDASLFERNWTTRALNPQTLDRLECLIDELKNNGIYVNMNLHVSRTFSVWDGLSDVDSLPEFGKLVNYFDPQILELHKEYARQLLTHVNPYTRRALVDDPVLAMVEITNENSLYRGWRDGNLKPKGAGGNISHRHARMLDTVWITYLRTTYGTTSAIADAWNSGSTAGDEVSILVNGSFETAPPTFGWTLEQHASAAAFVQHDSTARGGGLKSARVTVTASDGIDWHLQWKQTGISWTKDSVYRISFVARADSDRIVNVSVMKDVDPWTWYGGLTIRLNAQWQEYSFSVRAAESLSKTLRLSFGLGQAAGTCWFDDLVMTAMQPKGLLPNESLESGSIRRIEYSDCAGATPARVRDQSAFYLAIQDRYFAAMRSFLKDTLGIRVPLVGTNWNVGPADIAVQSKLDYVDNHAYWDHPSFPSVPWSSTDWSISNTPMVQSADGGTMGGLFAGVAVAGKPYTISEYNHAFPNAHQSEGPLFLASYASLHDADAVMFFDYHGSVDDWETDKIGGYFATYRNSALMALMPALAFGFRSRAIAPSAAPVVLRYSPDDVLLLPRRDPGGWLGPVLIPRRLSLAHGIRIGTFNSATPFDPASVPSEPGNPFTSDTKQIIWNTQGWFAIQTPRFAGITGLLNNGTSFRFGPAVVKNSSIPATVTLLSLTEDSISVARRSLLSISTRAQNTGMTWDGVTTVHNNWGTAPTQVAPVNMLLQLALIADSVRVYPLDGTGKDIYGFQTYLPAGPGQYLIPIDQTKSRTMWFGIELLGTGSIPSDAGSSDVRPQSLLLDVNFPNPFNPATVIQYSVAAPSESRAGEASRGGAEGPTRIQLTVFDLLGREVAVLVNDMRPAGVYSVTWNAATNPSGVYFYRLTAGGFIETRKMMLSK